MLEDKVKEGEGEQLSFDFRKRYIVPGLTESPSVARDYLELWIRRFHILNNLDLPKGFSKKNKKQLLGMYHGMLKHYGIDEKIDILKRDY